MRPRAGNATSHTPAAQVIFRRISGSPAHYYLRPFYQLACPDSANTHEFLSSHVHPYRLTYLGLLQKWDKDPQLAANITRAGVQLIVARRYRYFALEWTRPIGLFADDARGFSMLEYDFEMLDIKLGQSVVFFSPPCAETILNSGVTHQNLREDRAKSNGPFGWQTYPRANHLRLDKSPPPHHAPHDGF